MCKKGPPCRCLQCGKTFSAPPSAHAKYCSRDCKHTAKRKVNTCQWCGKPFLGHRHSRGQDRMFCNAACQGLANRKPWHGHRRRPGWWRYQVALRDRVCQGLVERNGVLELCGSTTNLQSHHILSWADYPALRLDLTNGILLCGNCHKKRHPKIGFTALAQTLNAFERPKQARQKTGRCEDCDTPIKERSDSITHRCMRCARALRRLPQTFCLVCGIPLADPRKTGCCWRHSTAMRRGVTSYPASPGDLEYHLRWRRKQGRTCATCGESITDANTSGFCRRHFPRSWPSRVGP